MNTSNFRRINAKTLHHLSPSIREAWRTDNMNVFLAICVKDCMKKGQKPEVIIASASILVLEWLAGHLEKRHSATAITIDCDQIILSLVRESVTLAEVLP